MQSISKNKKYVKAIIWVRYIVHDKSPIFLSLFSCFFIRLYTLSACLIDDNGACRYTHVLQVGVDVIKSHFSPFVPDDVVDKNENEDHEGHQPEHVPARRGSQHFV